jgi:PAS domain S-box-containing protein
MKRGKPIESMETSHDRMVRPYWNILALALAIVVFMIDLAAPRGWLSGIPYFFLIWMTYFSGSPRSLMMSVVVASGLIIVGFFFSAPGVSIEMAGVNRLATLGALWVNGFFIYRAMDVQQKLQQEVLSTRRLADELKVLHENSRAQSRALFSVMEDLRIEREQLRTSEELFRVTLEANPTAIIMATEKGIVKMVNREAERLFCSPEGSMIGKSLRGLLPEIELYLESDSSISDLEPLAWETVHHETFARTLTHEDIPVQVNTAFVRARDSLLAVITVIDISALKTHAIKLQQAREVAERASRARGEFLANMSHEIRTPMTAILGYVEIISERTDDPDNLQALDTIRSNGRHLLQILNDILDLSKIDAGKLSIAKECTNISEIVGEIRSLMDLQASDSHKTLDFEFATDIPEEIDTDPLRLRQILLNLVRNAIKFTPRGSIKVTTSYLPEENLMRFDIADTGIGISKEDQCRLFQPFSQVDSSTTREYEGSGLGLVISRRLAQALGGDLTVLSEVGKGSTFTLTISGGNVSQQRRHPLISPKGDSKAIEFENKISGTILVVDDRRDIRFLAQHLIERAGGNVMTATNGQEAIELLTSHNGPSVIQNVDLILMDMQMPVMDGYQATRILRDSGFSKPIVALTANAMLEDREKCLSAGCTDFIPKPIDRKQMVALLRSLLNPAAPS